MNEQLSIRGTLLRTGVTAAVLWLVVAVVAGAIADARGVLAGFVSYGLLAYAAVLVVVAISALAAALGRRRGARSAAWAVLFGLIGPVGCAVVPFYLAATAQPFVF